MPYCINCGILTKKSLKCRSCSLKEAMNRPEVKIRQKLGMKLANQNASTKLKRHLAQLKHSQNSDWRKKISETTKQAMNTKEIKEKHLKACQNLSHRLNISNSVKQTFSTGIPKQKEYNTRKLHNSFNTSKPEEEIYQLLIRKFDIVERQYRSEKYPFSCDFYIPSLDLYIEYQGNWTHGLEPFNKNSIQCITKLKLWEKKIEDAKKLNKKSYYQQAKYVWTDLDVRKRQIAFDKKLNWIEFFNLKSFKKWYKGI